ncbi:response regulator [[Clostridium] fimetarium]|uniref:Stage 0 sporulation protein A homolog n=1 Tax=[Clostridium] fimetarium TaxID=99656 RepID=A0A1I0MPV9_9FIRM|nr:response regulator [[Clostridium] fimetarium]SEV90189.1 two-component system, chemotaxis family, response regulator CheY [[Clostridium] fimetarium]
MDFNGVKVLICDDSVFARRKLKDYLNSIGFQNVLEATDGEAAVEQYKENKPDIVFMDIVMPKKDGVEAVGDIIKINPDAKIIMTSSVGTQDYLKESIKAGACDFVQKPLENDKISSAIKKALTGGY